MTMNEPIGGYFELELSRGREFHQNAIKLNSARHSLEYIIIVNNIQEIWLPHYSCDVLWEPCIRHQVNIRYYSINDHLEIDRSMMIPSDAYVVYTNYFGVKDVYVHSISKVYKNLIVDNAQAFFSLPISGVDTIYSARKFFGVPDGGYLYAKNSSSIKLELGSSLHKMTHLLLRIEKGAEGGYDKFRENDGKISDELLAEMSLITRRIMASIDYEHVHKIRISNFIYLHHGLKHMNLLDVEDCISNSCTPMVYPLRICNSGLRAKLIENRIFVAQYWPNVKQCVTEDSIEFKLVDQILPLPIDQRYSHEQMEFILRLVKENA